MSKHWADKEKEYIRANASMMKDEDLARKLTEITGRKLSVHAVRKQRQKMGLMKAKGRGVCRLKAGRNVSHRNFSSAESWKFMESNSNKVKI